MSSVPTPHAKPEQDPEKDQDVRHEQITGNILTALNRRLHDSPVVVIADAVLAKTPLPLTADVVVVPRAETRPSLIIEVLRPSTEGESRGVKFAHCRHRETVIGYILVSQERPFIEQFTRQGREQWLLTDSRGLGASLNLPSYCELPLSEIYAYVKFPSHSRLPAML